MTPESERLARLVVEKCVGVCDNAALTAGKGDTK